VEEDESGEADEGGGDPEDVHRCARIGSAIKRRECQSRLIERRKQQILSARPESLVISDAQCALRARPLNSDSTNSS
jgi:hypothetical protein